MAYKVIKTFCDLQDDNFKYEVGDEYPRLGFEVSLARIEELSSSDNRRHMPLIEEVANASDSEVVKESKEVKKRKRTTKKKED